MRYADTVQDIYNDLYLNVVDLQERFNITHADLLQEQSDVEADRLASLEQLHEDHQDRLAEMNAMAYSPVRTFNVSFHVILRTYFATRGLQRSCSPVAIFKDFRRLRRYPEGTLFVMRCRGLDLICQRTILNVFRYSNPTAARSGRCHAETTALSRKRTKSVELSFNFS